MYTLLTELFTRSIPDYDKKEDMEEKNNPKTGMYFRVILSKKQNIIYRTSLWIIASD